MEFTEAWDDTCSSVGHAARCGNIKELLRLINEGYPVDVADNRGWRPIHEAAALSADLQCLKELLKHENTNVNWQTHEGETPALLACKRRRGTNVYDALQLLLRHNSNVNIADNEDETPLLAATRAVLTNVVELLITEGNADPNKGDCSGWHPLHEAATHGHTEILQCLLRIEAVIDVQDECGMTPIFTAAQHGRVDCLKLLLNAAIQRNQSSLVNKGAEDWATPLMIAAQQGFTECVRILLAHKANPNLQTEDSVTALHLAVQGDHVDALKLLIEKMELQSLIQACQYPNIANYVSSNQVVNPLHLAVEWNSYKCLLLLLDAGFPVDSVYERYSFSQTNRVSPYGLPMYETSLSYAAFREDVNSMAILLKAGAQPTAIFPEVLHPLVAALLNPSRKEADLLLKHGANINYCRQTVNSNECMLVAAGNQEALYYLLLCGADPRLCFPVQQNSSMNLFMSLVFLLAENQSGVLSIISTILQFTEVTPAIRADIHAASKKSRDVYTTTYDAVSWQNLLREIDVPTSLQKLCRINIRRLLYNIQGNSFKDSIHQLTIPLPIIKFLLHSS